MIVKYHSLKIKKKNKKDNNTISVNEICLSNNLFNFSQFQEYLLNISLNIPERLLFINYLFLNL